MKRNIFGDAQPIGTDEIVDAIDEKGLNPSETSATISLNEDDDEPFKGWVAELVGDDEDGETHIINTLGYIEQRDLITDLKAAGITSITL